MSLTYYKPFPNLQPVIKKLAVGEDHELELQLVAKSKQPHVLKSTPNDAAERFSSLEAIQERKKTKKRDYYWLLGANNDLAGIIWFGPKAFPLELQLPEHPIDTFAIRLYQNYLGKGLAVPFFEQSLSVEYARRQERGETMSLWGVTDSENSTALAVYLKVGFEQVQTNEGRTYMIMPSKTIAHTASHHQLTTVGESA
jgi:hypothetical protein